MSNSNTNDVVDTPQEVFNLLPAWARQAIYVLVVMVGVASAVYLSVLGYLGVSAPAWYGAATAGWVTLTGAFGLVAASNTAKQVTDTTTAAPAVAAESNPPTVAAVAKPDVAVADTSVVPEVSGDELAAAERLAVSNTGTQAA
jgi:hypothetical protein